MTARALILALRVAAIVVGALAARAGAAPRTAAIGFDHLLHDRDVSVSGADPIACARCHALVGGKLVGRPGHAACFAGCHGGAAPVAPARGKRVAVPTEPDQALVCTNCHAEAALAAPYRGALAVPYPPYTIDRDFALAFGHRSHRDTECARCHAGPQQTGDPHRRCAGCHDGAARGPAMTSCTTCHTSASGRPRPPALVDATIPVTGAFSHGRHAARGGAGARCATCHAEIRDTDDNQLPRPTAATCAIAGCHDQTAPPSGGAKAAFAVTIACTRCHRVPPSGTFVVARPTARFSHRVHAAASAGTPMPCAACHPAGARGEVAVAGHGACVACHAADFGSPAPTICGACHTATEPWRPLAADQRPAERTELGATLDHAKHGAPCTSCHTLRTASQQLRPPRGHAACTTAGCHAVTSGPAPLITACDGCHQLGLAAARQAARAAAPWSVRAAFDHRVHGEPTACTTCHTDLSAPDVLGLATPAKATCAPCHDGRTAFSLTGTGCPRCHGTVAAADARRP